MGGIQPKGMWFSYYPNGYVMGCFKGLIMYIYKCEIIKVIDGDTLDIIIDLGFNINIKERVRLSGIDTPEVFGHNASSDGREAKEFVELWVDVGQRTKGHFELHSKKYDAREKYGRVLGEIKFVNSNETIIDLAESLIAVGYIKEI